MSAILSLYHSNSKEWAVTLQKMSLSTISNKYGTINCLFGGLFLCIHVCRVYFEGVWVGPKEFTKGYHIFRIKSLQTNENHSQTRLQRPPSIKTTKHESLSEHVITPAYKDQLPMMAACSDYLSLAFIERVWLFFVRIYNHHFNIQWKQMYIVHVFWDALLFHRCCHVTLIIQFSILLHISIISHGNLNYPIQIVFNLHHNISYAFTHLQLPGPTFPLCVCMCV